MRYDLNKIWKVVKSKTVEYEQSFINIAVYREFFEMIVFFLYLELKKYREG
jgi:hypothetical protein